MILINRVVHNLDLKIPCYKHKKVKKWIPVKEAKYERVQSRRA